MAVRYVKDFEFPASGGDYSYTGADTVTRDKAPAKRAAPRPAGREVQPSDFGWSAEDMSRAERGYKDGGKVAKVMGEFGKGELHSGSKKGPKVTNPKQAIAIALSEQRAAKKAKGGKIESVPVKDIKSGKVKQSTDEDFYGKAKDAPMPPRRPMSSKKGGMAHEDVAEDKSLIKSMVKPGALKKADGGVAMQSPLQAMAMRQQMARKAVPVAPRGPMIPQQAAMQAAPAGGPRVGVNAPRPGGPNVGAIRAAMARRASQAMPENAPAVMKKGGKVC